ncbi:NAD(P)-dependent dehydrogenase, short-chain alcohol dehydrogenase family [Roseovarius azorensis]|uniref:NAD(P)-dependent dehydrogenase, short-chain alcohol dehydrogenase family n=1 Tax=Roseovarius azorensis TaxID=1287727 RepID=A0A1H7JUJ3_9RHOB|nr:SDR family oxidoreductase [Roseovarius azorensis]SEK78202.1 NAD(P)-dependent dehydrogenase, short-chain alcohol dehydrogenase family [Roseovarius azorensis]
MKRALITGAGKRLGRAMALELARQGHDVAVHYATSADAAEEVAQEIRAMGRRAITLHADLLDETQVTSLVTRAAEGLLGPVTTLVNNASVFDYDTIDSATRQSWDRHIESNLRAPFVLTQAMARDVPPPLTDENGEPLAQGLVINMIDQRVRKLTPEFMTYTIAKMGLWAFTQTAARALAPRVRVNAIGPGPTLQGHRQSDAHFDRQRKATILRRGANAGDITGALRYFLDAPAVTGQLLCVDGGQHLAWQTPDVLGPE